MLTVFVDVIWLLVDNVFGPIRRFDIVRIPYPSCAGVLPIVRIGALFLGMNSFDPLFGHGTTPKLLQCTKSIQHPFLPLVGGTYRVLDNSSTWYVVLFRGEACVM